MWRRNTLLLSTGAGLFSANVPQLQPFAATSPQLQLFSPSCGLLQQQTYGSMNPQDVFTQVQLGSMPPLRLIRTLLLSHFEKEMEERRISEAKVNGMDMRTASKLLKQVLFNKFLNLPFRCFTFDIEFTGIPRFTQKGATEDICEVAFYHPESGECYHSLVKPLHGYTMQEGASKITGITDTMLANKGKPFKQVWSEVNRFLAKPRGGKDDDKEKENILLLSHGGKLSDVSMLKRSLSHKSINKQLPAAFEFGDTFHIMRDLHRKRPVTSDKMPPSWGLEDTARWLQLDIQKEVSPTGHVDPRKVIKLHRAEPDARLTWATLMHTLERYGDDSLTPNQQLVARFFDQASRRAKGKREAKASPSFSRPADDVEQL